MYARGSWVADRQALCREKMKVYFRVWAGLDGWSRLLDGRDGLLITVGGTRWGPWHERGERQTGDTN